MLTSLFGKKNKKKKILIISPYFYPENFPINTFASELQQFEFQIDVLTSLPNYRNFGFYDKYSFFKGPYRERYKNCNIIRLPVIPRLSNSITSIFLFYFSFFVSAIFFLLFFSLKNRNKYAHVMSFCGSPVYVGFLGKLFSFLSNTKSSQWIQDIWPEAIITSLNYKYNFLFKLIDKLQSLMWSSANLLIAQSEILEIYLKTIFKNKKIITLNNPSRDNICQSNIEIIKHSNDEIHISYFGNIGKTQNLEFFIENFVKLKINNYFLNICGDGRELEYLKQKYQYSNIHFFGWVDSEELDRIAKKTDYFFLSLKDRGRQNYIIPSKFQTYLGYTKPVIFIGNIKMCELINNNNLGFSISHSSLHMIQNILLNLRKVDSVTYQTFQQSIVKYYENNYKQELLAKYFIKIIKENDF